MPAKISIRIQEMAEATEPTETKGLDYIHFDTIQECERYLRNNPQIVVTHLCCGGKGYAVPCHEEVITKYIYKKKILKTNQGTCDICFMENVTLHYTCTSCKQPFCMDCLQKIGTKVCPYCRGRLA